ncbi:hypothetical protein Syun_014706 [Stephania yunnanensis]|uniref:Uncharacterized protein n=1 Tax=Stephania yunnanensis TaxID=152371 RepID=A0AAP0JKX0_9MAGN
MIKDVNTILQKKSTRRANYLEIDYKSKTRCLTIKLASQFIEETHYRWKGSPTR